MLQVSYITETFSNADTSKYIGIFAFLKLIRHLQTGEIMDSIYRYERPKPLFASVELGDVKAGHGCNPNYSFVSNHNFYDSHFFKLRQIRWYTDDPSNPRPFFDDGDDDIVYDPGEDYLLIQGYQN